MFYYLLRHSILNYSYFLNEEEFNFLLKNIKDENLNAISDKLIKNHLIVPDNYSEDSFLKFIVDKNNRSFFGIFYLIFDTDCNLNCKYCYTEGSVERRFKRQICTKENLL